MWSDEYLFYNQGINSRFYQFDKTTRVLFNCIKMTWDVKMWEKFWW